MTIRAFPRSLIARLVGISLLLLLVVQAAGFAVVRASIDRNARSQIARELDTDERVWHRLLEQNADRLRQGSGLLAADFGFRSAVNSGDQGTIQSALENHGARIGAVVTALLDTQFALRAASLAESMPPQPDSLLPVIQSLAVQPQASQVAVLGGQAYMFVMVPLKAPVVIGWVLMGFPIGQPLAEEMRQLLAVDVAVLVQPQGAAMSLPVSTLTGAALAQLRDSAGAVGELETEAGTLLVRSISFDALGGQVHALLLRSVDPLVAPYRQLQFLLASITVGGLLLFAVGSGAMARRVTTPLRSLLTATGRLARTKSATWRARSTICAWTLRASSPRCVTWLTGTA